MPLKDVQCGDCGHIQYDQLVRTGEPAPNCSQCESTKTVLLLSAPGGYQGNFGGGSTPPKGRGSFKRAKRV